MKKAVVEAWLSGLRSGKFEQTRGQLCDTILLTNAHSFCCIGVGAVVNGAPDDVTTTFRAVSFLDLDGSDSSILVKMNDKEKKSFLEIADWIEANILPNATE